MKRRLKLSPRWLYNEKNGLLHGEFLASAVKKTVIRHNWKACLFYYTSTLSSHFSTTPSSSFTLKEEPQPHEATAFGLSIVNPPPMPVSLKSISTPYKYLALSASTTTFNP